MTFWRQKIKKRAGLVTTLLGLILILSVACITGNRPLTVSTSKAQQYLAEQSQSLDITDNADYSSFAQLTPVLGDYDVFFTGESHGLAYNHDLEVKILKYLYYNAGVRVFLIESGYASAAIYNTYVQGGSEGLLTEVFNELKGTFSWTKEQYDRWKNLRSWNLSLPESERITVIGIDIDHQVRTALSFLGDLLPSDSLPVELAELNDFLRIDLTADEIKALCVRTQEQLQQQHASYTAFFGDALFEFSLVVDNIVACYEAYAGNFNEIREAQIYHNFKLLQNRDPETKYYGQWGAWHIAQSSSEGVTPLVGRMVQDESKVLPIHLFYADCTALSKGKEGYGIRNMTTLKAAASLAKGNATLFVLQGAPEELRPIFTENEVSPDDYPFIILIRNSPASVPLQ